MGNANITLQAQVPTLYTRVLLVGSNAYVSDKLI